MKRKIIKGVSCLVSNPRLFFRHLSCEMVSYWPLPRSPVQKRINGVLFKFDFGYDPAIKRMYFGCYEIETIEVMKNVLKPGDVFIDIGANIGYLSTIGAGFVGKSGQVHSFEPVPQYFQRLEKMAMMNPDYRIEVNQCALGEEQGIANIDVTNLQNIGWNTMVPGFMSNETRKETLEVPVYRLDSYIKERVIKTISLIKIDVEGFEFSVLKGLGNYFENNSHRPVIICEIAPSLYPLLRCTLAQVLEYMKNYNYNAYSIVDTNTEVDITRLKEITNIVFRHRHSQCLSQIKSMSDRLNIFRSFKGRS